MYSLITQVRKELIILTFIKEHENGDDDPKHEVESQNLKSC